MFITKTEYNEHGPIFVHKKCFWNIKRYLLQNNYKHAIILLIN